MGLRIGVAVQRQRAAVSTESLEPGAEHLGSWGSGLRTDRAADPRSACLCALSRVGAANDGYTPRHRRCDQNVPRQQSGGRLRAPGHPQLRSGLFVHEA